MSKFKSISSRRSLSVRKLLVTVLLLEMFSGLSGANATLPDPTFTVPVTPITVNEQTSAQVFPGLTMVDTGTNYSGGWIEYSVDTSTAADSLFLETSTVATTTLDSITVVDTTIFKGNGTSADAIGVIDSTKNGRNGNNLLINFSNTFSNGSFANNTSSTVGDVVSLSGWTAYKRRVYLGGASNVGGWATPADTTFPSNKDSTTNFDSSGASNSYSVNPSYAGRAGGGYSVQLATSGGCDDGYCIIRGPYIVSNSPVYLQGGDSISFWWSAIGASDAYDVYGYLLNTTTGATIKLLDSTGANGSATQPWTQVTRAIVTAEAGSYKFVFVAGTWDATGGQAEGASLLLDDVSVTAAATSSITAANLGELSRLLKYQVTNDAPELLRTVRIATNNAAVGGVQTLNIIPINDPIALQDPGSITRLRTMSDSSTATGTLIAYDPDTATVTAVPATFLITGGTADTSGATVSLIGQYGLFTVDTTTGNYSYSFYVDTVTVLTADSFETFTVTAFDGVDTATGQLKIKLLATLPVSAGLTARTLSFTSPSPLTFSKIYGETFTVTATPSAGSGDGVITYSSGASTGCSVAGNTVTITSGTGTCTITGSISAGTTYASANTSTSVVVTVAKRQLTVNGANQEMVFNQSSPNLDSYSLIGTLAGSDAITVTGSRQLSIITGVTPITLTVTFTTGSAADYDLTINSGSLIVNPGAMGTPHFGEVTRQIGGFTVIINNYNPNQLNTFSSLQGVVTLVGPIDGIYKLVVTGLTNETQLTLNTSQPGYIGGTVILTSGPLYPQKISLDLSSLNQYKIGFSKVLKELTTVSPEGSDVTYTSLTPEVCEISFKVKVTVLSGGTCTIQVTGDPSPTLIPGASATSSFTTMKAPSVVNKPQTQVPSTPAEPEPNVTPSPSPSSEAGNSVLISFNFNKYSILSNEQAKLKKLLLPKGVVIKVIGYAQKNHNQSDVAISLDRAIEVKKSILKLNPTAKVTVIGMGNKPYPRCSKFKNKCAVISLAS